MEKQLAIKGHKTRGKEVIELLQVLGGKNLSIWNGNSIDMFYFVDEKGFIDGLQIWDDKNIEFGIFTLEKFLEKFPFKINDVVINHDYSGEGIITEMVWDSSACEVIYCVKFEGLGINAWCKHNELKLSNLRLMEVDPLHELCESKTSTLFIDSEACGDEVEENDYYWSDEMFEGLADCKENVTITLNGKDYNIDVEKAKELGVLKEKDTSRCKSWEEFKKKYLKKQGFFYNECDMCIALTNNPTKASEQLTKNEAIAIKAFSKLLKLRRDWIGDWNPDWSNGGVKKYCIEVNKNEFHIDYHYTYSRIFSFPTKEMAEGFLKCFKVLFEQCKNLI